VGGRPLGLALLEYRPGRSAIYEALRDLFSWTLKAHLFGAEGPPESEEHRIALVNKVQDLTTVLQLTQDQLDAATELLRERERTQATFEQLQQLVDAAGLAICEIEDYLSQARTAGASSTLPHPVALELRAKHQAICDAYEHVLSGLSEVTETGVRAPRNAPPPAVAEWEPEPESEAACTESEVPVAAGSKAARGG
jgi:hypothetical protein